MQTNFTTQHQLNHRSIRFFKETPVNTELNQQFFDIINRTASSNGMQTYSIIRVTDQSKRDAIAKVANQPYIALAPELIIFVIDAYRMKQIAVGKGYEGNNFSTMDVFFQGSADAHLAAQNLTNAIESHGLGAVFLGSILNDSQAMIDILDLPELTFPILGMLYGYPADDPQLKPRIPINLKVAENSYPYLDDTLAALSDYDNQMRTYYDSRSTNQRSDTFTNQVILRLNHPMPKRQEMLKVIRAQGFDLKV